MRLRRSVPRPLTALAALAAVLFALATAGCGVVDDDVGSSDGDRKQDFNVTGQFTLTAIVEKSTPTSVIVHSMVCRQTGVIRHRPHLVR